MMNKHANSPCCGAGVCRYGSRRRQCRRCKKTWRIRPKKRGRNRLRLSDNLLASVFDRGRPIAQLKTEYPHLSVSAIQKRMHTVVVAEAAKPRVHPRTLDAPVLVMDGIWYEFKGTYWILYLFLLKKKDGTAYVLDPVMVQGKESLAHWQRALRTIPSHLKKHIRVVVSDNFRSSVVVARKAKWLHQLCHFHLIAELRRKRGQRKKKTISAQALREEIYQSIRAVLCVHSQKEVARLIKRLRILAEDASCPVRLSFTVREFVRRHSLYRTYLDHPEYDIPTTTNAVESFNKLIRKHTRYLRTPRAVQLWATVFVRRRKTIACNGAHQPN